MRFTCRFSRYTTTAENSRSLNVSIDGIDVIIVFVKLKCRQDRTLAYVVKSRTLLGKSKPVKDDRSVGEDSLFVLESYTLGSPESRQAL